MPLDLEILGQGVYSPTQAARLIGSTSAEVLRWTTGNIKNRPLWYSHYRALDDAKDLNFLDLIELRVVKQLRLAGLSLQAVRYAIKFATERLGVDRPLASKKFSTDGLEIFMDAIEADGELVSLSKKRPGQKVFASIVNQSLRDLEYEEGVAARWRPKVARSVVIDPKRQFGAPLLDRYGISTATLSQEYETFHDDKYLAKIYEIPLPIVREAIRYESLLDRALGQSSL